MSGTPVTDYSLDITSKLPGMDLDNRVVVGESHVAIEELPFGSALVRADGVANGVQLPKRNVSALVAAGDLVTSNVVNGLVNGVAISPITFASTNVATVTALAEEIVSKLADQGIVATYAITNSNRTITFTGVDATITFSSFVVTAGSGQTTYTYTYTTLTPFRGVALWIQKQLVRAGVGGYAETETLTVRRRGLIAVNIRGGAVVNDDDAYACLATPGDEGGFTNVSTGNIGPVGKFRAAAADDTVGALELNLP